jgi:hypothetical protein
MNVISSSSDKIKGRERNEGAALLATALVFFWSLKKGCSCSRVRKVDASLQWHFWHTHTHLPPEVILHVTSSTLEAIFDIGPNSAYLQTTQAPSGSIEGATRKNESNNNGDKGESWTPNNIIYSFLLSKPWVSLCVCSSSNNVFLCSMRPVVCLLFLPAHSITSPLCYTQLVSVFFVGLRCYFAYAWPPYLNRQNKQKILTSDRIKKSKNNPAMSNCRKTTKTICSQFFTFDSNPSTPCPHPSFSPK